MAKGTRYTPEFRAKAVRLLAESRSSYSSETNAISAVAKDLGIAPESLRRWRNQSDATVAEETRQSAEDAMAELKKLRAENAQLRRANEILTTASAFFRGQARPDTALMAASRGGTDGLIRHGDHGTQYISTVYATGVMEYGVLPSTGTVGDSYDNAMAESADGAYKTELVWRRRPFADLKDLELATFRWVSWWNSKRLHQSLGYRTPEAVETEYHQHQAAQAAPL